MHSIHKTFDRTCLGCFPEMAHPNVCTTRVQGLDRVRIQSFETSETSARPCSIQLVDLSCRPTIAFVPWDIGQALSVNSMLLILERAQYYDEIRLQSLECMYL